MNNKDPNFEGSKKQWQDYCDEMEKMDAEQWEAIDDKYAEAEFEWYVQTHPEEFVKITEIDNNSNTPKGVELMKKDLKI